MWLKNRRKTWKKLILVAFLRVLVIWLTDYTYFVNRLSYAECVIFITLQSK